MFGKSLVKLLVFGVFSFVFGALVMGAFSFTSKTSASSPDAATVEQPSEAPAASARFAATGCTPDQVAVFGNRIHVHCTVAVSGISYFAYPTSNAVQADRLLGVLTAAQVANRKLTIWYDPNTASGASFGCLVSDCRPIDALAFGN